MRWGFREGHAEQLSESIKSAVSGVSGVDSVSVDVDWKVAAHAVQKGVETLKNIKNVIAVASGKGGVGKSTVSANLALALAAEGATVGMLDADIYGPSQPRMLGAGGQPESRDGKTLEPVVSHDVQSMSIGYLIEEDTPMIWRGPMVTQALELLRDTNWDSVDYLIIDLHPAPATPSLRWRRRSRSAALSSSPLPRTLHYSTRVKASRCSRKFRCQCSGWSKT